MTIERQISDYLMQHGYLKKADADKSAAEIVKMVRVDDATRFLRDQARYLRAGLRSCGNADCETCVELRKELERIDRTLKGT